MIFDGQRMARLFFFIVGLSLLLNACAHSGSKMSPREHVIDGASHRVRNVFARGVHVDSTQSYAIEIRQNRCKCTPDLPYEARLFGFWHRVDLDGTREQLEALSRRLGSMREPVIEVNVRFTRKNRMRDFGDYTPQLQIVEGAIE